MTTRAKGTGLGLAIVKKIVEEHFGQHRVRGRARAAARWCGWSSISQTLSQLAGGGAVRHSEEDIANRSK